MRRTRRTPVSPGRTQAERRAHSQRELVRAAVEIVAERGVSAATFQAIGERSGYHRSLVTQHFGNRTGLIDAILEYLQGHGGELMEQEHLDDLPGLQALLKYIDVFLTDLGRNREIRAYFMLLSSAVAELDPMRATYAVQNDRIRVRVQAIVERGQSEGTVRGELDANALAVMVGSLLLGLSMQLIVDPALDLAAVRATAQEALRNRLAA